MQVIVQLLAEEVVEELLDTSPIGLHILRPELRLRLALKDRFFDLDADSSSHTVADVTVVEVLTIKVLDDARHGFFEGGEMCPPLRGILPIDEAVEVFPDL